MSARVAAAESQRAVALRAVRLAMLADMPAARDGGRSVAMPVAKCLLVAVALLDERPTTYEALAVQCSSSHATVAVAMRWLMRRGLVHDCGRTDHRTVYRVDLPALAALATGEAMAERSRWTRGPASRAATALAMRRRWAAAHAANKTTIARTLEFEGRTQTVREWAAEIGVSHRTITWRLREGWPIERVLTPKDARRKEASR